VLPEPDIAPEPDCDEEEGDEDEGDEDDGEELDGELLLPALPAPPEPLSRWQAVAPMPKTTATNTDVKNFLLIMRYLLTCE